MVKWLLRGHGNVNDAFSLVNFLADAGTSRLSDTHAETMTISLRLSLRPDAKNETGEENERNTFFRELKTFIHLRKSG